MRLDELLARLRDNFWADATDVEILVDTGDGEAYVLREVFDYGNSIVLVGDRAKS